MAHPLPSLTAASLLAGLESHGICNHRQLSALFGAQRDELGLNAIELKLVAAEALGESELEALIGVVSGREVVTGSDPYIRPDLLHRSAAKLAGAMVLGGRERTTVAFVEDLPDNLALVAQALGESEFEVVLLSASRFAKLFAQHYGRDGLGARRPLVHDLVELFDEAVRHDASDLHLSPKLPPLLRVSGRLQPLPREPLRSDWLYDQVAELLGPERLAHWDADGDADLGINHGNVRFRINVGKSSEGPTVAARRLPLDIPDMDALQLPGAVRKLCELERGLVLVTGPTGSGKSTTIASMLSHIVRTSARHLITLEDPIEYHLPQGKALVHQRELSVDFPTFPRALRQALRQDPDIIFVGELRDEETTRVAITAAETGHLVLSTVHTYDAVSTLGRVIGQFTDGEQPQVRAQLSYVLKGVISQTLVPLAKQRGRVAAYEVLLGTPAVANNLRKIDGLSALRQILETSQREGMQTMEMDLARLVRNGEVLAQEAEFRARRPEEFRSRLNGGR